MGAASLVSATIVAALVEVAPPPNGEAIDLVAVRDQARKLRTTLPKGEPIEIRFAPGIYFVTNTLSLYRADGNTMWSVATPGAAVISGGIEIPRERFAATKLNGVDVLVADVSDILLQELEPWPKDFRRPPCAVALQERNTTRHRPLAEWRRMGHVHECRSQRTGRG